MMVVVLKSENSSKLYCKKGQDEGCSLRVDNTMTKRVKAMLISREEQRKEEVWLEEHHQPREQRPSGKPIE
jgi:hypothetical protein